LTISFRLRGQIEASVSSRGAVIVDLIVRGESRTPVFEVYVDNLEGVTLDLCRDINKDLQSLIDAELPGGRYRLEVSSPGLDRPLKYPWQYRKHVGKLVEVTTGEGDTRAVVTGHLTGFSDEGLTIEGLPGGPDRQLRFAEIRSARVRTPW